MKISYPFIALAICFFACSCTGKVEECPAPRKAFGPVPDSLIVTDTYVYSRKLGDDSTALKLDIMYDPCFKDVKGKPVILNNHGGGWNSDFDRTQISQVWQRHFAHKGYVCVSIDYREGNEYINNGRLVPPDWILSDCIVSSIDMAIEDLFDATSFVVRKARKYGIDPAKIIVAGGSAGAINGATAEWYICNEHPLARKHLPRGFNYAGIICLSGGIWKHGSELPEWKKAPCPFLFVHGSADELVSPGYMDPAEMKRTSIKDKTYIGAAADSVFARDPGDICAFGPEAMIPGLKQRSASYRYYDYQGGDHMVNLLFCYVGFDRMFDFTENIVFGGQNVQETLPGNDDGEPRTAIWILEHKELLMQGLD